MSESKNIPLDEVWHVAALSRLVLTKEEAATMQRDLSSILGYVKKLDELDTAQVAPTSHAVELSTVLRPDEPAPGLPLAKALQNAPERLGDGFGVPKIIE